MCVDTNPGGTIISFEKLPKGTISESTRKDLDAAYGGDWPDVEYFSQDAYAGNNDDYLLGAPDLKNYTAMAATVIALFSPADVTIISKDTDDHPGVNPAWLTDDRDMEVLFVAFKRLRQLFKTKALQPILIGDEVYPGHIFTQIRRLKQTSAIVPILCSIQYAPAGWASRVTRWPSLTAKQESSGLSACE